MPPKKSIFRQPGARHFQLVHRSQRDPLIHDPEASAHVLKPFERENVKKGKSRTELEQLLSPSEIEHDRKHSVGEAALYGVYYDDTEYDYMQHLRAVGQMEEGVESVLIEAPVTKAKEKKFDLSLPQDALPSISELPRTYESQQAIPESISGFQPEMDPHLRQVLEALEDDAFVNDDLDDAFFGELVADGERGDDEEFEFEFHENGVNHLDDVVRPEEDENAGDMGWEERFAKFKKEQKQDRNNNSEFGSEGGDTIGGLPSISVIGGSKRRRRKGTSDASGYSMSSSSMYRNDALKTLDERFDQIMDKSYNEEEEEEISFSDDEDSDSAPELITSREDFDDMVNEFLNNYEILGRKMKQKLEGETGTEKLDTIRRALGQDDRVLINDVNDDDDAQDVLTFDETPKEDRWDCETILTTYSSLENHPRMIRVSKARPVPKISVDPKTGFPVVDGVVSKKISKVVESDSESEDTETEATVRKKATIARPRNESKEDKKARKEAAKTEKQSRRAEKRNTKEQFELEIQHQKLLMKNKEPRMKKL